MTPEETRERERLHKLWATKRATRGQILRCMALDREAERDKLSAAFDASRPPAHTEEERRPCCE
jgi:hypothetical protein